MATPGLLTSSILLVNDTFEERELYARTLRAAGHRVIIPEDSVAAYQIAATRPPDIVVTDVRITGSISGLELTRRLRSNQRTAAVGIIVLTICRGLTTRTLPSRQERIRCSKNQ
jgi:DNA-binding response OmpR family regulator